MSKTYSDEELISRVWDVEEIKKLVHKRVYYIADDLRSEELADLWVSDPDHQKTASFGRNWGYYVGLDNIKTYYTDSHTALLELQKSANGASALNVGNLYAHPASTGLVELAGDGKTAKGIWYCISQETTARGDSTADAEWMMEKLAIDLIRENDGWKIWHLVIATDLHGEAGQDYSQQPIYVDWDSDAVRREFGVPTIEKLTHDATFNWWDDYPFMPKPYEAFHDAISYGPEGFVPPINKGWNAKEGRNYL